MLYFQDTAKNAPMLHGAEHGEELTSYREDKTQTRRLPSPVDF